MATRRAFFGENQIAMPATTMNVTGGSSTVDPDRDNDVEAMESKDSFRRRTTPIIGKPNVTPSTFQDVLAILNGSR